MKPPEPEDDEVHGQVVSTGVSGGHWPFGKAHNGEDGEFSEVKI